MISAHVELTLTSYLSTSPTPFLLHLLNHVSCSLTSPFLFPDYQSSPNIPSSSNPWAYIWIITSMCSCHLVIVLCAFCKLQILYYYKICLFSSPTRVAQDSRRNSLTERTDALYICVAFLLVRSGFLHLSQFFIIASLIPFFLLMTFPKTKKVFLGSITQ